MANVACDKTMSVPLEALHRAITDFKSYPEFIDEVVSVQLEPGGTPTLQRVTFELEVMKRFQYTLEFRISPNEVAWKLVKSNFFKINDGKWVLKAEGEKATQVHYELEVGFGFLVPGWVIKKLTETNLPKMLDAYEARARAMTEKTS